MNKHIAHTKQPYLVAIHCMVYNHAPFLRECLEGFVMQQTTFPFVAIVHDDASTDNSASIIREYETKYPHIFKPIYQTENQYSKPGASVLRIIDAAIRETGAKYIAICEGDDYWIDPYKLQKQVDFMEQHPEYAMCHTNCGIFNQETQTLLLNKEKSIGSDNYLNYLLNRKNIISTLTVLYKREVYEKLPRHYSKKAFLMSDFPLWIEFAHSGRIKLIEDVTAVYRVLPNSASHSPNLSRHLRFMNSVRDIRLFYAKIYNIELEKGGYTKNHITDIMHNAFIQNNYLLARRYIMIAHITKTYSIYILFYFIGTLSPFLNLLTKKMINTYHRCKTLLNKL